MNWTKSLKYSMRAWLIIIFGMLLPGGNCNSADCKRCTFEETTGTLKCSGFNITDEMLDLDCTISEAQKPLVDNLIIENSTILSLDLNFIKKNNLSELSGIGIHDCNITSVFGIVPCHLNSLRLSNNSIHNFSVTLMNYEIEGVKIIVNSVNGTAEEREVKGKKNCSAVDLSLSLNDNFLEELPMEVVGSKRLKSLHLSGNPLKCEFIWENVWDHLKCQERPLECRSLFVDENSTNCQFYRQTIVPSGIFHYNLAQIFDSKIRMEEECYEMNKTCDCHPFNLLREDQGGNPTVYLTINCHGKNFTELPTVSEYTWELNVSSNYIQNVNKLNDSMYKNLRRLDISHNYVNDLSNFTSTGFMDRFDLLYVNTNKFREISSEFLNKVKESEGKGLIKLGSQLECECNTATQTKGRLIEIQNNILDLYDVVCWNIMESSGNFLRMTDLKVTEVCSVPDPITEAVNWMLVIIIFEILGIIAVIFKVFYDWRSYQRTGILPWIADKLPSLPCDGILE